MTAGRFSPTVERYWGWALGGEPFSLVTDAAAEHNRRVVVLARGNAVAAAVSPEVATMLVGAAATEQGFRRGLEVGGIALHPADRVFYFDEAAAEAVRSSAPRADVRRLSERDRDAFDRFEASVSPRDRDDAWVELDHWAVFGAFVGDDIVSAASMYPWGDGTLADIGVLTATAHRGQGFARAVVLESSRFAFDAGLEPQYRCQLDNAASLALASRIGLTAFGDWEVVSPD